MRAKSPIHGLMAEFDDPNALVVAAQRARHEGYRRMDAYSPFPIEELHDALGMGPSRLPLIVLVGGLVGCIGGGAPPGWVSGGEKARATRGAPRVRVSGVTPPILLCTTPPPPPLAAVSRCAPRL